MIARIEADRAAARRLGVGEVVSETFSLYGRNAGPLLGSAIVVFVIVGPLSALVENSGGVLVALLAAIIRLAGFALYAGFVVRLVQDARDGRRDLTLGDLLSSAAPAILPLIVFGILFAIGVAIGLALLIIPGLILLTFWSVGAPAIVVERAGPIAAFGRSWRLVRGDAWSVFATLVVVLLIVIAIGIGLAIIATPISNGATVAASIISNVITAPIFSVAVSVMYFELGGARAAAGTPAPPIEPPPPSAPAV
jgi:hypothetical protein